MAGGSRQDARWMLEPFDECGNSQDRKCDKHEPEGCSADYGYRDECTEQTKDTHDDGYDPRDVFRR